MSKKTVTGNIFDMELMRKVYALISPYRGWFYFSVFLTIALAVVGPTVPYLVQRTLDKEIMNLDYGGLRTMALVIMGLLLLQGILFYCQTYLMSWLGQNAIQRLRNDVFQHIIRFKPRVFDKTPIGRLITRAISDVEAVADIFGQGIIIIIGDFLQIIVIISFMFYQSWQLTLVSLIVFPLLLFSSYVFKEKVKVAFQDVRNQVARLNSFLQEHITGMQIIQIFNREKEESEKFKAINADHRNANIRSILYYSVFFPVIEILSAVAIALIVWYGSMEVLAGAITFGTIVAFILYVNMLFRPIRQIADRFNTLQMGMVASERVFNLMAAEDSMPDKGEIKDVELKGEVVFENTWFAYNPDEWVLKNVSFRAIPGKTLAIVGPTGSGKTTIISLINRLYDIERGSIKIDGKSIQEYDLEWIRKQVAVVLQDVFLFSDTIGNNIKLYNPKVTNEQIREAAKLVGAEKFIDRLPNGFDYRVQERGSTLSTGQRQLVSFLRAIIQDPKILILDEATSSIDNETEELIQRAIDYLLRDRTAIVIAHRLSTIRHARQILVLEKGCVKEIGTHDELLEQEGLYKKLYELQFEEMNV